MNTTDPYEAVAFYPEYEWFLPNGRLLVRTTSHGSDEESEGGCFEACPDDPRYEGRAQRIGNKKRYFEELRAADGESRRERREAGRAAPPGGSESEPDASH